MGAALDILQLLRTVNIDELKAFARTQIAKMDSDQQRLVYLTALPINNVLHDDVMQHVLSYSDLDENIDRRFACKKWNRLCKLNRERMLRTLYQSLNEKYPKQMPPDNNTWVWDNGRNKLHAVEQGLGYKGVL